MQCVTDNKNVDLAVLKRERKENKNLFVDTFPEYRDVLVGCVVEVLLWSRVPKRDIRIKGLAYLFQHRMSTVLQTGHI